MLRNLLPVAWVIHTITNWLRIPGSWALKATTLYFQDIILKYKLLHKDRGELMTITDDYLLWCSTFRMKGRWESKWAGAPFCPLTEPWLLPNDRVIFLYGPVPLPTLSICVVEVHKAPLKDSDLENIQPFGPCNTSISNIFDIGQSPPNLQNYNFIYIQPFITVTAHQDCIITPIVYRTK